MGAQHIGWAATNEALCVHTSHIQQWNMAVVGPEGKSPEGLVAIAWGSSPEGVQRRANLIAAAPELLAALKALDAGARPVNWDDDNDLGQVDAWRQLDAAIAKATGDTRHG